MRQNSPPLRLPSLRHQLEQRDDGRWLARAGIFPVQRIYIDSDAFGVAPIGIVAERDVLGGISGGEAGLITFAGLKVDIG